MRCVVRKCCMISLIAVLVAMAGMSAAAAPMPTDQPKPRPPMELLAGHIGIWFFYLSTCPYCQRQEPILAKMAARYDIRVTPISLDGFPPPGRAFHHFIRDRGQAAKLGVHVTPTLYVTHPASDEAALLATGLTPAAQLKRRIVRVARKTGWLAAARARMRKTENKSDQEEKAPQEGGLSVLERLEGRGDWQQ